MAFCAGLPFARSVPRRGHDRGRPGRQPAREGRQSAVEFLPRRRRQRSAARRRQGNKTKLTERKYPVIYREIKDWAGSTSMAGSASTRWRNWRGGSIRWIDCSQFVPASKRKSRAAHSLSLSRSWIDRETQIPSNLPRMLQADLSIPPHRQQTIFLSPCPQRPICLVDLHGTSLRRSILLPPRCEPIRGPRCDSASGRRGYRHSNRFWGRSRSLISPPMKKVCLFRVVGNPGRSNKTAVHRERCFRRLA